MLAPASRGSRSPSTAFTVLVTLTLGLLVWLVLTSFGLARVQQQATQRLQQSTASLLALVITDAARLIVRAEPSLVTACITDSAVRNVVRRDVNEACATARRALVARARETQPVISSAADSAGLLLSVRASDDRGFATEGIGELAARIVTADGVAPFVVTVRLSAAPDSPAMLSVQPQLLLSMLLALLSLTIAVASVLLHRLRRDHAWARQRSGFTSSVSHEMRTPLAQILLFAETLQLGRTRNDAERMLATGAIVQEARRLMRLVDNVLRFARIEQGGAPLRCEPMPVEALVRETTAQFAPLARSSQVTLDVHVAPNVSAALGDPDALRQVLLNLLDNAVKYGPASQVVRTSVDRDHDSIRIVVEDEGPGIALANRERIWLPFERVDDGLTSTGGSGLGLTIVRELVEAMGGGATCESRDASHRGARFVVRLPAIARSAA